MSERETVVQRITNDLMPLLNDDKFGQREDVEKALRAAYNAGLAAVVNTVTDNEDDHGTAEHCDDAPVRVAGGWRQAFRSPCR